MIERRSEHEHTTIFSLNNFYGEHTVGASFRTPLVEVVPVLSEFALDQPDPSGFRHNTLASGFVQILGSGRNNVSLALGPLDLNITNVSPGSGISCTRCFIFRINRFDCPTTRITGMKVWAQDTRDFLIPEAFEVIYETRRGDDFPSGFQFGVESLADKSKHMPKSLPQFQNVRRHDGAFTIHGSGDLDVSEYILTALAASGTLPLGEYVGDPAGFVIRVTYNVDNLSNFFD